MVDGRFWPFWERSGNAGVSGEKCGLCGPGMREMDAATRKEVARLLLLISRGVGNGIEAFLDRFSCRTVGLEKMVLVQLGRSGYSCVVLAVDERER